jgi:hypothetical protein
MVLMSAGKRARNQASLVNRPTCGGNKKAGLITYSSLLGVTSLKSRRLAFCRCLEFPLSICPKSYAEGGQNQVTSGGVGRVSVLARRGRGGFVMM